MSQSSNAPIQPHTPHKLSVFSCAHTILASIDTNLFNKQTKTLLSTHYIAL